MQPKLHFLDVGLLSASIIPNVTLASSWISSTCGERVCATDLFLIILLELLAGIPRMPHVQVIVGNENGVLDAIKSEERKKTCSGMT